MRIPRIDHDGEVTIEGSEGRSLNGCGRSAAVFFAAMFDSKIHGFTSILLDSHPHCTFFGWETPGPCVDDPPSWACSSLPNKE